MKCQLCKKVKITHKNRHFVTVNDIDTKKQILYQICNGCKAKFEEMEKQAKDKAVIKGMEIKEYTEPAIRPARKPRFAFPVIESTPQSVTC